MTNSPFKVEMVTPEVGDIKPWYGYITSILEEREDGVTVEVNNYMHVRMKSTPEKTAILKERSFTPGVFVGKVVGLNPIMIEAFVVIYGKKKEEIEQ